MASEEVLHMRAVEVKRLVCQRCGHYWIPRKTVVTICPKCKSPYWDRPREGGGR